MFDRCPKAWIRDDAAREAALLGDVLRFQEHHVLPVSGGWVDQPASFTDAVAVAQVETPKAQAAMRRVNGQNG